MSEVKYKRILLKVSGEALAGSAHRGLDFTIINKLCDSIKECVDMGVQIGLVIGAGNFWRGVKDGAELIAVSTNDSWFWDSAAVHMHNAQSQFRALESGRYVVRSANTGVSSIISPTGEVLDELEPLVDGYVIADVYLRDSQTLYTLTDDVFAYACLVLCAVCVLAWPIEKIWLLKESKQ